MSRFSKAILHALPLTLATSCALHEIAESAPACDTTPIQHDAVTRGALRFELWIAKDLCVTRYAETTMISPGALSVRIINTGKTPVQMVAADPDATFVAKLWDADQVTSMVELHRGPEPEDVATVLVDIGSGQTWQSPPIQSYMNILASDILAGSRIDGTVLPESAHLGRSFGMEVAFSATFNAGAGFVAMSETFRGTIEMVMVAGDV
ncbi:MAG: hypothetical protein ACRBN8_39250 [Nannocystales bacterium]